MPMQKQVVSRIRGKLMGTGRAREAAFRDGSTYAPLHWMAAGLFLATGAEALAGRRVITQADGPVRQPWDALGMAPLVVAPLAGAAHAVLAARPEPRVRTATRVLDGMAVGAAVAAVAAGAYAIATGSQDPRRYRRARNTRMSLLGAIAPLAFGATGILGLLLEREEREEVAARRRLARRASLMERLVPRRKPKLDRIVVHI